MVRKKIAFFLFVLSLYIPSFNIIASELKVSIIAPEETNIERYLIDTSDFLSKWIIKKTKRETEYLRKRIYFSISYFYRGIACSYENPIVLIPIEKLPNLKEKVCLGIALRCRKYLEEFYKHSHDISYLSAVEKINGVNIIIFSKLNLSEEILENLLKEGRNCSSSGKNKDECKKLIQKKLSNFSLQLELAAFNIKTEKICSVSIPVSFSSKKIKNLLYQSGIKLANCLHLSAGGKTKW
ncbi:MAG: hypothetical protein ABGX27_07125 [Desulfurobacteriaceae bacterium]